MITRWCHVKERFKYFDVWYFFSCKYDVNELKNITDGQITVQKQEYQPKTNQKNNIGTTKTTSQNSPSSSEPQTFKQIFCLKLSFKLTNLYSVCLLIQSFFTFWTSFALLICYQYYHLQNNWSVKMIMVSTPRQRQPKRRLLNKLYTFDREIIIGSAAGHMPEKIVVNEC